MVEETPRVTTLETIPEEEEEEEERKRPMTIVRLDQGSTPTNLTSKEDDLAD